MIPHSSVFCLIFTWISYRFSSLPPGNTSILPPFKIIPNILFLLKKLVIQTKNSETLVSPNPNHSAIPIKLYFIRECSAKKRENLLVETDIICHFRGLILYDANISNNSINLKIGWCKGTFHQVLYALTLSFLN